MKNVTVSMDDRVADWARIEAAKQNKSLSKMLGDLLEEQMRVDVSYDLAYQEWKRMPRTWASDGGAYPSRSELYTRCRG